MGHKDRRFFLLLTSFCFGAAIFLRLRGPTEILHLFEKPSPAVVLDETSNNYLNLALQSKHFLGFNNPVRDAISKGVRNVAFFIIGWFAFMCLLGGTMRFYLCLRDVTTLYYSWSSVPHVEPADNDLDGTEGQELETIGSGDDANNEQGGSMQQSDTSIV